MTSLSILGTLQQVQANLAGMFPAGVTTTAASDSSTLESFQQILATLSPTTASGVLGGYPSTSAVASTTGLSASVAQGGGVTGSQVVADARKYLGVPYVFGGTSANGLDCSGLVQRTYKDLGITLPRLVHQQEAMGTAVPSLAQAQPGDLIVFKGAGHIAIYEGNGRVLHAPSPGRFVTDQKLWVNDSGIEAIRRIVPSAGTPDAATGTTASGPTVASGSTVVGSSAAVQAAALATVQAIMQADFGLLSSATSDPALAGLSAQSTGSASSMLQSALSAMTASASAGASASGSTGASATSSSASDLAAQQTLATMQSMLVQGRG